MSVAAYVDEYVATCIDSFAIDAAAFSLIAAAPKADDLISLAAEDEAHLPAASFPSPGQAGEWVVRVKLVFDTDPGPSFQESFFRLRVDSPDPTVDGRASAPVACQRPGGQPARTYLSLNGGSWLIGAGGSFTWRGMAGDASPPIGPLLEAPTKPRIRIKIEDDVCAAFWRIQLAPTPASELAYQEPFVDLVPDTLDYYNTPPGSANRFLLDEIPSGDWVVSANLWFGKGHDSILGQTTTFWHVIVQ